MNICGRYINKIKQKGELKMIQEEAKKVKKSITLFGGDFMRGIKVAMDYADERNLQKIKKTWANEWNQYLEMYENAKKKGII